MKPKDVGLLPCACLLVFLLLGCNLVSFQPNLAATDAAQTKAAIEAAPPTPISSPTDQPSSAYPNSPGPQATGNQIVAAAGVEVFLPAGQDAAAAGVTVTALETNPPPPPPDSYAVGTAVDISAAVTPTCPVLITFSYDPADLPTGVPEEHLYVSTWTGDRWETVPDGLVDTSQHTVSVSVEHFSIYGLFQSAAEITYGMVETLIGDEIRSAGYTDLPRQIRRDLDHQEITPQNIAAVVNAQLSLTTKAASGMISLGNLVSKTVGLAIGATDGKQAVAEALAEVVMAEGGGELGALGVILYDSYTLGTEIGTFVVDAAQVSPPALAAKAAAWLLTMEMQYINANLDQGLEGLWRLNPASASRLSVFVVYVDAEPWSGHPGWGTKGVKFYYYDDADGQWVNYHDAMTYWQIEVEVAPRVAAAPPPTRTAARPTTTRTPRPTPSRTPTRPATPTRPTGPTTVWLEADGSGDYATIQEAIDAVEPGSTLVLGEGTFRPSRNLSIAKPISILGAGINLTTIEGSLAVFKGSGPFAVEDITFNFDYDPDDCCGGVEVEDGEFVFRRCRFTRGWAGIRIGGGSIGIVEDCEADHLTYGIEVFDAAQPTLENNRLSDNENSGIAYFDNAAGVARKNECFNNSTGIWVHLGNPTLVGNVCRGNTLYGIQVYHQSAATVEDNVCNHNGDSGILFLPGSSGIIQGNECAWNGVHGIGVPGSNAILGTNYCHDNGGTDIRTD